MNLYVMPRFEEDEECDPLHGPLAVTDAPPASSRRRLTRLAEAGPVRCAQHQQHRSVRMRKSHKDGFITPHTSLTWKHANNCRCLPQSAVWWRFRSAYLLYISRWLEPSEGFPTWEPQVAPKQMYLLYQLKSYLKLFWSVLNRYVLWFFWMISFIELSQGCN